MLTTTIQDPPACWTHRGGRRTNQDAAVALRLEDGRELVAVADGMGGLVAGAVASRLALETLVLSLRQGAGLLQAVRSANAAVCRAPADHPEWQGMGTTLVALLRTAGQYEIANVGDSRAYRIDQLGIEPLTRDHSFIAEAIERQELSLEEARRSPWRHAVTRALGLAPDVEVDTFGPFPIRAPHYLLLCSNGLVNSLPDASLRDQFADDPGPETAAERLGSAALAAGSSDNVTAAVARFGPPTRLSRARHRAARRQGRPAMAASVWRTRLVEAAILAAAILAVVAFDILLAKMM